MKFIILEKAKQVFVPASPKHKSYRRFDPRSLHDETAKSVSKEIVGRMGDVMKLFNQKKSWTCGPASIRIALSAFIKSVTEVQASKIAKSTASYGTSHGNIINAIKKEGLNVIEYKNLSKSHSINVLKEYTSSGSPVIVDWLKTKLIHGSEKLSHMKTGVEEKPTEDSEHYSVIKSVDDKNVILLDPLEDTEESLPIDYFLERWRTISEPANRWFLVLSMEK
jgi:predicted double-glycine peptidase